MVRHIIGLKYKEGFSLEENIKNAEKVKAGLEQLKEIIDGIVEFTVHVNVLSSSDMDLVINSLFESEEALKAYQIHPEHVRVTDFARSVLKDRVCIDYIE